MQLVKHACVVGVVAQLQASEDLTKSCWTLPLAIGVDSQCNDVPRPLSLSLSEEEILVGHSLDAAT